MQRLLTLGIAVLFLGLGIGILYGAGGIIDTGNVGVRKTLGTVTLDELEPGIYLKWPFISTVAEYSAKEIAVDLNDLTPKARDNLSLRDLDITVFYKVAAGSVAETEVKYARQSLQSPERAIYPAYTLVQGVARNIVYEEVSKIDSLVLHTQRDALAAAVQKNLQAELDRNDRSVFQITRVIVRSVMTDPAIEESIRLAVSNQKRLEAMKVQTEIAQREAEIKITESKGIAESNRIINQSLTREYLQHETNLVLQEFARKGGTTTVVIPANMNTAPLINLPAGDSRK